MMKARKCVWVCESVCESVWLSEPIKFMYHDFIMAVDTFMSNLWSTQTFRSFSHKLLSSKVPLTLYLCSLGLYIYSHFLSSVSVTLQLWVTNSLWQVTQRATESEWEGADYNVWQIRDSEEEQEQSMSLGNLWLEKKRGTNHLTNLLFALLAHSRSRKKVKKVLSTLVGAQCNNLIWKDMAKNNSG